MELILTLVMTAVLIALFIQLFKKKDSLSRSEEEIPDVAMINYLLKGYETPNLSIASYMEDMRRKGLLNDCYTGQKKPKEFRAEMIFDLVKDGPLEDLRVEGEDDPSPFLDTWYQSIVNDLKKGGYIYEKDYNLATLSPLMLSGLIAVFALVLLSKPYLPALIPLILSFICLFLSIRKSGKLPEKGRRLLEKTEDKVKEMKGRVPEEEVPFAIAAGLPVDKKYDHLLEETESYFMGNPLRKKK